MSFRDYEEDNIKISSPVRLRNTNQWGIVVEMKEGDMSGYDLITVMWNDRTIEQYRNDNHPYGKWKLTSKSMGYWSNHASR